MITRETIERIHSAIRIEEVVGDYVSLRKKGANYLGLCPFHDEKTGSFTVSPSKGIYKCFGCGKAGNAIGFVMEMEHCTYPEALRLIAKRYRIEIVETEQTAEEKAAIDERESLLRTNEWAREWFQKQLFETQEGQDVGLSYFISRGLHEDTIHKYQLGYSPERSVLYKDAQKAGYKEDFLVTTGLCGKSEKGLYDRFRDRVIFPIHSVSGKPVAFAGRILKKKDNVGKYVNSPESIIYSKGRELYGLYQAKGAISKEGCCYLVEGQMDVLSMYQAGIQNVVCSGGTALTPQQARLMHRFTEYVTILYDGDAAGIKAALRGINILLEEGLNIKVVLLPEGEDPDSLARSMNASDFIAFIKNHQQDFIQFKTDLLLKDAAGDPVKQAEVIRNVLESIMVIPDLIRRNVYIQSCSNQLNMAEEVLQRELKKMRGNWVEEKKKQKEKAEAQGNREGEREKPIEEQPEETKPSEELTATSAQTPHKPIFVPANKTMQVRIEVNYLNIIQLIVKYGEQPYCHYDDGTYQSIGDYILEDLAHDHIDFVHPTHRAMIAAFRAHSHDTGFEAERFFTQHTDPTISTLAINLVADRYPLSKIHGQKVKAEDKESDILKMPSDADHLQELTVQLLCELKLTLADMRITAISQEIHEAEKQQDHERVIDLLREQIEFEQFKQALCQVLGQRFH